MKRSMLLFFLAAALILSGCHPILRPADPSTPAPMLTKPAETAEPSETTEPADAPVTEPAEEAPASAPTEAPSSEPDAEPKVPGFDCGILVCADGKVFSAESFGICSWVNGYSVPIFETDWSGSRTICSDGTVIYYIDDENRLCRVNAGEGTMEVLTEPFGGNAFLGGAAGDTVYVSCWNEEAFWAPDVYRVNVTEGAVTLLDRPVDVRCEDGYLILRDFATDVSARATWIYNGAGELILDGAVAWRAGVNNGELWYSAPDAVYAENQFLDQGVHIYLWADSFWTVYADYNMDTDGYYGANLVDDFLVTYGNYGTEVYNRADASPADATRTQFMPSVTKSFTTDQGKFYQTYDQVWHETKDGDLELMVEVSLDYTQAKAVFTDALYITTDTGVLSVPIPQAD